MDDSKNNNQKLDKIEDISNVIDDSIRILLNLCNDDDDEIRLRAIEALQYIKTPKVEVQVYKALSDADELVRVESLEILGLWKSADAEKKIIEALSDESELVRSAAAIALADIAAKSAEKHIVQRLNNASDEEKVSLYFALCKLGNDDYFYLFLNGLFDKFYRIRCATANLIVDLATPLNKNFIINLLLLVLKNETTEAAKSSIKSAIDSVSPETSPSL